MKKVISACVDQILEFDSEMEITKFLEGLESRKQLYQIVWKNTLNNGKVQIRIKKQYNNHFMEEGETNAEE
jgi:transcriptional regulator of heat shock response